MRYSQMILTKADKMKFIHWRKIKYVLIHALILMKTDSNLLLFYHSLSEEIYSMSIKEHLTNVLIFRIFVLINN
jgi:hypothetical protein